MIDCLQLFYRNSYIHITWIIFGISWTGGSSGSIIFAIEKYIQNTTTQFWFVEKCCHRRINFRMSSWERTDEIIIEPKENFLSERLWQPPMQSCRSLQSLMSQNSPITVDFWQEVNKKLLKKIKRIACLLNQYLIYAVGCP